MLQSLGYVLPRTTAQNKLTATLLREMQRPLLPTAHQNKPQLQRIHCQQESNLNETKCTQHERCSTDLKKKHLKLLNDDSCLKYTKMLK